MGLFTPTHTLIFVLRGTMQAISPLSERLVIDWIIMVLILIPGSVYVSYLFQQAHINIKTSLI